MQRNRGVNTQFPLRHLRDDIGHHRPEPTTLQKFRDLRPDEGRLFFYVSMHGEISEAPHMHKKDYLTHLVSASLFLRIVLTHTMNEAKEATGADRDAGRRKHGSLSKSSTIHSDDVSEVTAQNKQSTLHEASKKSQVTEKSEEVHAGAEDNWDNDPDNARNWSPLRKWTSMLVVCPLSTLTPSCDNLFDLGIVLYPPSASGEFDDGPRPARGRREISHHQFDSYGSDFEYILDFVCPRGAIFFSLSLSFINTFLASSTGPPIRDVWEEVGM